MLGLDQELERFLRKNPNGLSGVMNSEERPDPAANPGSTAPAHPRLSPSSPAPPAQSDHKGFQTSNADETTKGVDRVIESLWQEGVSSDPNGQFTGWKRAADPRIGGSDLLVVYWRQSPPPVDESPAASTGFGGNQPGTMTPPLRQPGKDEPSRAAPLAVFLLASEVAVSRRVNRLSRFRMRKRTEHDDSFRTPSDAIG